MKRERRRGDEESGVTAMKRAASRLCNEIFFVGEVSASVLSNEIRYLPYLNLVPTEDLLRVYYGTESVTLLWYLLRVHYETESVT